MSGGSRPAAAVIPHPRRSAYTPRIRLDRWQPGEGQTIATFDVAIGSHVVITECRLMEAEAGGRWLAVPRRPVPDSFGDEWEDVVLLSPALRERIRRLAQDTAQAPIPEDNES